ncbi:UNVERIFIED_ORG: hypothetical protein FHU01_4374 [Citrobacter freundii]
MLVWMSLGKLNLLNLEVIKIMKRFLLVLCLFFCSFKTGVVFAAQNSFLLKNEGKKEYVFLDDLKKLPQYSFKTNTNYTDEDIFTGVKFEDFALKYGITGHKIRVFAWDGYSFSMSVGELKKYNVIIAYKKGGELMDAENLGPFALVYPRDLYADLNPVDADARTIWQMKEISVR